RRPARLWREPHAGIPARSPAERDPDVRRPRDLPHGLERPSGAHPERLRSRRHRLSPLQLHRALPVGAGRHRAPRHARVGADRRAHLDRGTREDHSVTVSADIRPVDVDVASGTVSLRLANGRRLTLHRYALRDACACPECRHPVSGQRLFESHDVLPGCHVSEARLDDDGLAIAWRDGHRSRFDRAWLIAEADAHDLGARPRRQIVLWGTELAESLPTAKYDDVALDRDALSDWLGAIGDYGFAVLEGAPTSPETV